MNKLLSVIAFTAVFTAQALAQSSNNPGTRQTEAVQPLRVMPSATEPLGPIMGTIGVATDPDPNVRLDLHRNYDHYSSNNN